MNNRWLLSAFFTVALLASQLTHAALIRTSDGNTVSNLASETTTVWNIGEGLFAGQLLGAFNVNVDGTLWDVVFEDGTMEDIFINADGFDAPGASAAVAFATALKNSVILDLFGFEFDSDPSATSGCEDLARCFIITPYSNTVGGSLGNSVGAGNFVTTSLELSPNIDISQFSSTTWANWSLASDRASVVTEPSGVALILLGVAGLAIHRRKTL